MEKNVKISITVPEDQKDRWKTEAEKRGQILPGFIRYCVECFWWQQDVRSSKYVKIVECYSGTD